MISYKCILFLQLPFENHGCASIFAPVTVKVCTRDSVTIKRMLFPSRVENQ